jgi:niacin transporter
MFSPLKIVLEPASFTLASHVAIFIAMFLSPTVAVSVALGTTLGFLLGGFPIVIVVRALSHVVFALIGSLALKKIPSILDSLPKTIAFASVVSLIHGITEVLVVTPFYLGNTLSKGYYSKGYIISVVLLVGVGTLIHSMVDFFIALAVWKPLKKMAAPKNLPERSAT